jgi:hypothetical protein
MSTMPHAVAPFGARQLSLPTFGALLLLVAVLDIVAFDQGWLASLGTHRLLASGGVLHEFFHDARHLLGVPCH